MLVAQNLILHFSMKQLYNDDMRTQAIRKIEHHPYAAHIAYREGVAHRTGLPDGCADIVTCAQSLHWMEPTSTLAEVARILRPGGLFAAYDYDWPPTLHWELDRLPPGGGL